MGYFGAIVRVVGRVVGNTGHDVPMGNSIAAQLVGHETTRFLSLTLQEFSEESPRRTPVLLHESSRARTMPTDRILTCRFDMTRVGRARSSD